MKKAYYPSYGLVDVIGTKTVGSYGQLFILKTANNITILAKEFAFRPLITKDKADEVLARLKTKVKVNPLGRETWNRRYLKNLEQIKSMDILDVADVFRELACLSHEKELSFGERKMLNHAKHLLYSELEEIGAV